MHVSVTKPMALEQVMSDRDSEDEVDDDVADFEDRQVFDDFFLRSLNRQQENSVRYNLLMAFET